MAVTKQKQDPKNGEITTTIETITPEIARQMLETNEDNRQLKPRIVAGFATAMKSKKWFEFTGEAIKFNIDGKLVDGQHRLSALIRANVSLMFTVVRNLPREAFAYLDQGNIRTSADVLFLKGVTASTAMSAIISKYLMLNANASDMYRGQKMFLGITNEDVIKTYEKHKDFWQELEVKSRHWHKDIQGLLAQSVLGSFYAFFSDIDPDAAEDFFTKLTTGEGLKTKFHPIAQLRELLIAAKQQTGMHLTTQYKRAVLIKAWNYFRTDEKVNNLTYNSQKEDFPKPI